MKAIFFLALVGCNPNIQEKLANIGEPPKLSKIINPQTLNGYSPVNMPMPSGISHYERGVNSLWEIGSRGFFKDQRANKVGDILTVSVEIDQEQIIEMKPTLQNSSSTNATINNALGLQSKLYPFFRKLNPGIANWKDITSSNNLTGDAKYDVKDTIKFKIAASVIQILPNGNMVVLGRQEIRLVNELREIVVMGIVRKEDVNASNLITADKISELRVAYGGRGELTNLQSQPWGQQLLNAVSPF